MSKWLWRRKNKDPGLTHWRSFVALPVALPWSASLETIYKQVKQGTKALLHFCSRKNLFFLVLPCSICLNSATDKVHLSWCTWKCKPRWDRARHLVAGSFANIRGCNKGTLTVLTNYKGLTFVCMYVCMGEVVLVCFFLLMSGGHPHCEFSTFNKKVACSWSYSDWMEMEWGWRRELQVRMDIFHRHLPDAVEAKKSLI